MKIRNGFVSNSSSMSFIISFPFEIKTKENIKSLLFQNISDSFQITDEGGNEISFDEIVEELLNQIRSQSPNDKEKAIDRLNGYIIVPKDCGVDLDKYNIKIFQKPHLTHQDAIEVFDDLRKEDVYIYTFTFDTSDYIYQAIARSLLFINLDHVHIINH